MRTTITIDDELLATLKRYFPQKKVGDLIDRSLRDLIAGEAADRMAALGGSDPEATAGPRKRPWALYEEEVPYNPNLGPKS